MKDDELVEFFKACKAALRPMIDEADVRTCSLIIVKENTCFDKEDGSPETVYDPQDSSVTRSVTCLDELIQKSLSIILVIRSDKAWKVVFQNAGLTLLKEEVQLGLPEGLFVVKSYVSCVQIIPFGLSTEIDFRTRYALQ